MRLHKAVPLSEIKRQDRYWTEDELWQALLELPVDVEVERQSNGRLLTRVYAMDEPA